VNAKTETVSAFSVAVYEKSSGCDDKKTYFNVPPGRMRALLESDEAEIRVVRI